MRVSINKFGQFLWVCVFLAVLSYICVACVSSNEGAGAPHENKSSALKPATAVAAVSLIPRRILFGSPDKATPQISPDGSKLAYLAPVGGVLNVWVGPVNAPEQAQPVTKDEKRGIRNYFWAYTNQHILYLQDKGGDENWHVYLVNLQTMETWDLTPLEGVRAEIEAVSYKFPNQVLIGLNNRDPQLHDVYSVDLTTGDRCLKLENSGFASFVIDDDYAIRFGIRMTPDGGKELLSLTENNEWKEFMAIGPEDSMTTSIAGFDQTGQVLYLIDSRQRNTAALTTLDLNTGKQMVVAENAKADLSDVLVQPATNVLQAAAFTYERKKWDMLDSAVAADFKALSEVADGDIELASRTLDDTVWIIAYLLDDSPVRFYRYERATKNATFLFASRSDLEGQPLVKMHPVIIQSRDGLELVSYLSLPLSESAGQSITPPKPIPLILFVHGGPWARSDWGYNASHQWFANRGYAVLDVNFRGSTGFGKAFLNAGNREWGAKMHDDLLDAVHWAVEQGIADPEKVGIFGGSYGGYAVLAALTMTPDTFACGADIVGPSNLVTLLHSIPPYWAPMIDLFTTRVGDHRTDEGCKFLEKRSPLTYVERIERPLLIAQGANDPRVKQTESDQIVHAMEAKGIPVTYVLYPDEGHGFARPENRLSFFAVAEAFMSQVLGGRFEPIGEDFAGSSITIPAGAQNVPGLDKALQATG